MYSLVTTTDNRVYLKFARRVNHKCSSHFPPPKMVAMGGKGYGNFFVVIILPCTHTSNIRICKDWKQKIEKDTLDKY